MNATKSDTPIKKFNTITNNSKVSVGVILKPIAKLIAANSKVIVFI
jgi:hypothetical protein